MPEGNRRATTLAQIVAIQTGVSAAVRRDMTDLHHAVQKPELTNGHTRTYQPHRDEDTDLPPNEIRHVQVRVPEVLQRAQALLTRLWDITTTKDHANCDARADIVVGEHTLARDVPVTSLLWLEKQLTDLRTFLEKLPVLDPAEQWQLEEGTGLYRTAQVQTVRTAKKPERVVKWEPPSPDYTQPPQVEILLTDRPVGTWTAVKRSGALQASHRQELLSRCAALQEAVKMAREAANNTPATDQKLGQALLGYVLDGTVQ